MDRREVLEAPGHRGRQPAGAQSRLQLRRDDRDLPHALPGQARAPRPGDVSQHHRQRGNRARVRRRKPPGEQAALLRQLPDHPGERHPPPAVGLQELRREGLPGRGRDRRDRCRDRRLVWRCARAHGHERPGSRAEVGSAESRGHDRAAARRRRRPARGTVHRHADEDRTGRPAPGDVRPQWRVSGCDRRAGHAGRVLRARDRGCTDRGHIHDAGALPVGRVPRDRRRAVANPEPRRARADQDRQRDRTGPPSSRTRATLTRWRGRGRSPVPPASSTGSAGSRSRM